MDAARNLLDSPNRPACAPRRLCVRWAAGARFTAIFIIAAMQACASGWLYAYATLSGARGAQMASNICS